MPGFGKEGEETLSIYPVVDIGVDQGLPRDHRRLVLADWINGRKN
jgi:hypothetical protein